MKKRSGYRAEQMRLLRRGFVRRMVIGLLAWSVLFGAWAVAVDVFVAPRVADAVSSRCPWISVSKEEAALENTVWYEASRERSMNTMIACYASILASNEGIYAEASDDARAVADALMGARQDTGATEPSEDAVPDVANSADAADAADAGGAAGGDGFDSADAADSDTSMGVANPDAPADSVGFGDAAGSSASQFEEPVANTVATLQNPDQGATHEFRASEASEDAIVADAVATMDESAKEALFEESCAALGTSPENLRVESPWTAEQSRALWNEIYYADGHMEYRDLRLYDAMRALQLPLACVVYAIGAIGIVLVAVSWLTRCFGNLFDAVEALFSGSGEKIDLPRELEPTARALEDLRRRHDDAQRASLAAEQRKNELVAYLAHDIRTPLTSIVGYLTLLAEAPDMPEAQRGRYAQVALDRSYRLEAMMEEFFEITRYNLSSIPIERQRFDAALLCCQVADEFYPAAAARSIDIDVRAEEPLECFADAEKVSRVLNNLLKNAVAYADAESTVVVRACKEDAPTPQEKNDGFESSLIIEVENQGREISPEHLQSIFEKFYREDGARSTQGGGAGLGLAIAREIAHAHGGDLTAQSVAGHTTFTLRVPA
ncbi:MAG: HAMP domain-containing sensor histidine kinase [Slackia sp.]|nr:HAMP domain-containing sensor histidine kinase [Slackia sp.]